MKIYKITYTVILGLDRTGDREKFVYAENEEIAIKKFKEKYEKKFWWCKKNNSFSIDNKFFEIEKIKIEKL